MSEYINNFSKREEQLKEVIKQLHAGKTVAELRERFNDLLQGATSAEIVKIEQALIAEGLPIEQVQFLCDIHVALFKQSLDQELPPEMQPGHPIYTFRAENEFAELLLHAMDEKMMQLAQHDSNALRKELAADMNKLGQFTVHYLRKENLLFPILEKYNFSGPSSVMWGVHDEIRTALKKLGEEFQNEETSSHHLNDAYQAVQHKIREMFYKEDHILFPSALERLQPEDWETIYRAEEQLGFAYVSRGKDWQPVTEKDTERREVESEEKPQNKEMKMDELSLHVGKLSAQQVDLLLRNLPVDVTFVDENDQVAFYSQSRERIFARTPAVIGRKVQMCHPPASVDKVQRILDDFRAKKRNEADFWIQMNGKFIHIRYYAIFDDEGVYRGTIEVTQDITKLRQLQGEKRLLDD
ncbi:MAG: DUF438 domain-containing protein [Chloroflexi bacterium]|nr:DUF438 domain-containing protein [Chloroflexota bacterium]